MMKRENIMMRFLNNYKQRMLMQKYTKMREIRCSNKFKTAKINRLMINLMRFHKIRA